MLLGGLWHGAAWTFVIWGALHGFYLIVHRVWSGIEWTPLVRFRQTAAWRWTARILLFHAVCLGWVFFRSSSFGIAFVVLRRLAVPGAITLLSVPVAMALIAGLAGQFQPLRWRKALEFELGSWPAMARGAVFAAANFCRRVAGALRRSAVHLFQVLGLRFQDHACDEIQFAFSTCRGDGGVCGDDPAAGVGGIAYLGGSPGRGPGTKRRGAGDGGAAQDSAAARRGAGAQGKPRRPRSPWLDRRSGTAAGGAREVFARARPDPASPCMAGTAHPNRIPAAPKISAPVVSRRSRGSRRLRRCRRPRRGNARGGAGRRLHDGRRPERCLAAPDRDQSESAHHQGVSLGNRPGAARRLRLDARSIRR